MWIQLGKTQQFVNFVKECSRLDMFHLFGYIVDLFPTESHFFHQVHFGQAVLPEYQRRLPFPFFGKA